MAKINVGNLVEASLKGVEKEIPAILKNAGKEIKGISRPKIKVSTPRAAEVRVDPVHYGIGKYKVGNRSDHYLTDSQGLIFDHYNNRWVDNEAHLGPMNEDALILWQYGLKGNPWQGDLKAIRHRLLRRGTERAGNRYATVDNGKLSVFENPAERLRLFGGLQKMFLEAEEVPVLSIMDDSGQWISPKAFKLQQSLAKQELAWQKQLLEEENWARLLEEENLMNLLYYNELQELDNLNNMQSMDWMSYMPLIAGAVALPYAMSNKRGGRLIPKNLYTNKITPIQYRR